MNTHCQSHTKNNLCHRIAGNGDGASTLHRGGLERLEALGQAIESHNATAPTTAVDTSSPRCLVATATLATAATRHPENEDHHDKRSTSVPTLPLRSRPSTLTANADTSRPTADEAESAAIGGNDTAPQVTSDDSDPLPHGPRDEATIRAACAAPSSRVTLAGDVVLVDCVLPCASPTDVVDTAKVCATAGRNRGLAAARAFTDRPASGVAVVLARRETSGTEREGHPRGEGGNSASTQPTKKPVTLKRKKKNGSDAQAEEEGDAVELQNPAAVGDLESRPSPKRKYKKLKLQPPTFVIEKHGGGEVRKRYTLDFKVKAARYAMSPDPNGRAKDNTVGSRYAAAQLGIPEAQSVREWMRRLPEMEEEMARARGCGGAGASNHAGKKMSMSTGRVPLTHGIEAQLLAFMEGLGEKAAQGVPVSSRLLKDKARELMPEAFGEAPPRNNEAAVKKYNGRISSWCYRFLKRHRMASLSPKPRRASGAVVGAGEAQPIPASNHHTLATSTTVRDPPPQERQTCSTPVAI